MNLEILQKAYSNRSLIALSVAKFGRNKLITGFISDLNDVSFIINEIDNNGLFIGYIEIQISDLIRLSINNRLLKRICFINKNNMILDENMRVSIWKEGKHIVSYLTSLITERKIATIFFEEHYITGILIKYDMQNIMVKVIGRDGDEDGESYYPINEIVGIRYDGIKEQRIKILYDNRCKFK